MRILRLNYRPLFPGKSIHQCILKKKKKTLLTLYQNVLRSLWSPRCYKEPGAGPTGRAECPPAPLPLMFTKHSEPMRPPAAERVQGSDRAAGPDLSHAPWPLADFPREAYSFQNCYMQGSPTYHSGWEILPHCPWHTQAGDPSSLRSRWPQPDTSYPAQSHKPSQKSHNTSADQRWGSQARSFTHDDWLLGDTAGPLSSSSPMLEASPRQLQLLPVTQQQADSTQLPTGSQWPIHLFTFPYHPDTSPFPGSNPRPMHLQFVTVKLLFPLPL